MYIFSLFTVPGPGQVTLFYHLNLNSSIPLVCESTNYVGLSIYCLFITSGGGNVNLIIIVLCKCQACSLSYYFGNQYWTITENCITDTIDHRRRGLLLVAEGHVNLNFGMDTILTTLATIYSLTEQLRHELLELLKGYLQVLWTQVPVLCYWQREWGSGLYLLHTNPG